MKIQGTRDRDARGSEPISLGDKLVGRTTSGAYGWRLGESLALGMVAPEFSAVGTKFDISLLGERHRAVVIAKSPFDPSNERLRA
jgi:dimethylglycine dehydrogenase